MYLCERLKKVPVKADREKSELKESLTYWVFVVKSHI